WGRETRIPRPVCRELLFGVPLGRAYSLHEQRVELGRSPSQSSWAMSASSGLASIQADGPRVVARRHSLHELVVACQAVRLAEERDELKCDLGMAASRPNGPPAGVGDACWPLRVRGGAALTSASMVGSIWGMVLKTPALRRAKEG